MQTRSHAESVRISRETSANVVLAVVQMLCHQLQLWLFCDMYLLLSWPLLTLESQKHGLIEPGFLMFLLARVVCRVAAEMHIAAALLNVQEGLQQHAAWTDYPRLRLGYVGRRVG